MNSHKILKILLIVAISLGALFVLFMLGGAYLIMHGHSLKNDFYFDLKEQKIKSCNNRAILDISIYSDSITKEGKVYDAGKLLVWEYNKSTDDRPAKEISFDSIPDGYYLFEDPRPIKRIKFKPNSRYKLVKSGYGDISFRIKVWTDSKGRIYKTTHPRCGIKSLVPKENEYP